MANGEGVTYTVKELLAQLDQTLTEQMGGITKKLETIDKKLDDKASNIRVEAAEGRMAAIEERVRRLELANAGTMALSKAKTALFTTLCGGLVGTLLYIASGGHL